MLKKAAALFLVCATLATWLGCGTTSSRYLYATIPVSSEIVIFREDPNSGVLTELAGSPITAGAAVQSVLIHPSGNFLYTADSGTNMNNVDLYTISAGGVLTETTPSVTADAGPTLLAMDAAGSFLYVGNVGSFDISVFSINSKTGVLSQVGTNIPIGISPINMKVSPSGKTLYVTGQGTQGYIEAFSLSSGVLTPVTGSPFLTGNGPYGLIVDSSGQHLYTANKIDNSISQFTINADGSLTLVQNFGDTFSGPTALLIDKSGKYMFVANQGSANVAGYAVGSDGALTLLTTSPFGTGPQPSFIASDPGGNYLFVGNQSSATIQSFSLDLSSGTLTSVSSYSVPGTPSSIVLTP